MAKYYVAFVLLSALAAYCHAASVDSWLRRKVHTQEQLIGKRPQSRGMDGFDANGLAKGKTTPQEERDPQFWLDIANAEIAKRLELPQLDKRKAKNLIMFLGDGMSLSTVMAARIRQGQLKGNTGEEDALSFEKFPYTGLSKTYCSNAQVPDSACTATAYLCGVKTNIVAIGVSANVDFNNCSASEDPSNHVSSIAAWAQNAGKSSGFVTTTTLTHASPSGSYGHTTNRFFECDTDITTYGEGKSDPSTCTDLATQLVTQAPGKNLDVTLGGGMGKFLPKTKTDMFGKAGERSDGKNLLSKWQSLNPGGVLAWNRAQLLAINPEVNKKVIGLFGSSSMNFNLLRDPEEEPSLTEMTEKAIDILSQNGDGYFLFVEGGLIDHGNHNNMPLLATDETIEMSKAIERTLEKVNLEETLIVVTSDHAHPLSIAGYPGRGTNILGLNQHDTDVYGVKYATLNYAVGTNQYLDENGRRIDLTDQIDDPNFVHPSYIESSMGVHGGDDVGIFAIGPQSHLFTGVMQQHTIPHIMAYAGCIGDGPKLCDNQ